MTQYAYFDHTASQPAQVLGWFDDATGGTSPPVADLFQITDPNFWPNRYTTVYYINANTLTTTGPGPALSTLKNQQINALTAACAVAVTGGYTSNALGTPHHYNSDQPTQQNLIACIVGTLLPDVQANLAQPFWSQDLSTQAWAMNMHNIGQIQQVGKDAKAMIQANQVKLATLSGAVFVANTASAVQSVIWT